MGEYAAIRYIEQHYKKVDFSEIYFQRSSAVTGIVEKNFNQEGAKAIFVHIIYWDSAANTPIIWTDQYNKVIFTQGTAANAPAWAPVYAVYDGQQLRITCNIPAVDFTVSYQYII